MRFSVAAVFAAVAAGVVAEEVRTVIVTETATYCPKSTDAIGVSPTESISIPAVCSSPDVLHSHHGGTILIE
ncbi:unnamed protein product [Aspergillus oryzae]|uniref:Unnamed protein product n=2 Tax=Aspergillus oryzae TaxID=5062 RepID=A0AAN4YU62_ASPOZ|nr:unnamed protein product [Aspergillus oryzae]GMF87460.1 unnamed protein product [Aspergillus oryzae]GMG13660.1 unnamed protein product [Aspergillus oryzae]GMG34879.1 unnamed protein product [Aspergillus oryzae]GMG53688.1 unnamed protein product [Aspergillus oryzae var. brunneus]